MLLARLTLPVMMQAMTVRLQLPTVEMKPKDREQF